MTSSSRRFETPDCLFCSDSPNNTQADFAVDLSTYATDWATVSTTGVTYTDAVDRFRYLTTRKTVDVRIAAYTTLAVQFLYLSQTSGGSSRHTWDFSSAAVGLMRFRINGADASTYQVLNFSAGNIITASWTMEPNPLTTAAANAVRSEVHVFNETAGTYEYHSFTHAEISPYNSNAVHAFWSNTGGASAYDAVRYMARISSAFHSSTETYESLVGNTMPSTWGTYDGGVASSRIRVFGGSYVTINPGTTASGFTTPPSRTPGPRVYKTVSGDCDIRARIQLRDSSGTGAFSSGAFATISLYASEGASTAVNWIEIGLYRDSAAPILKYVSSHVNGAGNSLAGSTIVDSLGVQHADFRITRVGQVFTLRRRAYDPAVPLSSDDDWITVAAYDRTANPMPTAVQYGPQLRTTGGAIGGTGTLAVCDDMYGTDANGDEIDFNFHGISLLGETRLEQPVPTVASGLADHGEFGGPVYAMAAKSVAESGQLLWGPIINEYVKRVPASDSNDPPWRDDDDSETNSWAWIPDGHEGVRVYGELLFRRPVPPDANKLLVRLHIQSSRTSGALAVTVRAYSMNWPGPFHKPVTSQNQFVSFYVNETFTVNDGTAVTGGRWYEFNLLPISRDKDGYTYFAVGIDHPFAAASQDTRVRAIVVVPVIDTGDGSNPFDGPGGFNG